MSAEPSQSFPHNTLWRKWRRRYFFDRFSLMMGAFTYPPVVCAASWLLHGPLWLTFCFGALWFLTNAFMTISMAMGIMFMVRQGDQYLRPLPTRIFFLWSVLVNVAPMIALLIGRMDWAFYVVFGLSELSGLWNRRSMSLHQALRLTVSLAFCFALAMHTAWMAVFLLLLHVALFRHRRPALREWIMHLPTCLEYVARSREACAAGGG